MSRTETGSGWPPTFQGKTGDGCFLVNVDREGVVCKIQRRKAVPVPALLPLTSEGLPELETERYGDRADPELRRGDGIVSGPLDEAEIARPSCHKASRSLGEERRS